MGTRRFRRAAVPWTLTLLLTTAVGWCSGFLYWHWRIAHAIRKTRQDTRIVTPDGWQFDPGFSRMGGRAVPYLLRELRSSVADRDRLLAYRWCVELAVYARSVPDTLDSSYVIPLASYIKIGEPMRAFDSALREYEEWWERERPHYPAWWAWWSGAWRE